MAFDGWSDIISPPPYSVMTYLSWGISIDESTVHIPAVNPSKVSIHDVED